LPRYKSEGKSYLTIARLYWRQASSVALSLLVAEQLRQQGYDVTVKHRDIGA
jgi:RNase adaptor protein for sRNA GlmZ degradation